MKSKIFGLLIGLSLQACASYTDETLEVSSAFRAGNYRSALEKLEGTDLKEQTRNRLLYLLEKSSILDRLGQRGDSRQLLIKADGVVDQLYTKSMSKEALTYIYNEGAQAYPGEDYEKVAIHGVLAHSFVQDGELSEARVEAARINTRLAEINSFYEENKNHYKEDAYARYLAGIIYESIGEDDNAIIDYKNSLRIYEGDYSTYYGTPPPSQLIEALYRLLVQRRRRDEAQALALRYKLDTRRLDTTASFGEIIVLHELGQIAKKEASEFIYPIGGEIVRFSFPSIKGVLPYIGRTGLQVKDSARSEAELTQNFNGIAAKCLEDRRVRMLAKSAARLIIKSQMTQKAQKEFGAIGWLAGNVYGAVTETADTRSWTLLPAAIMVSRLRVKPGTHEISLFNNGRQSDIKSVSVKSGKTLILRDF